MAGIDGLISGLKTSEMIASLMQIEARPQNILKTKVAASQTFVSALQQLNTKMAAMAEAAGKTAKPAGTDLYTAASSSDKVTAAVTAGAAAGSLDMVVKQTASAQVSLSAALTSWPTDATEITISAAGTSTTLNVDGKSLDEVVSEVNKANKGVTAVKIAAGVDAAGTSQYRIQLTSTATGADAGFSVTANGTDPFSEAGGGMLLKAARNAEVTLWAGVAGAETTISSATNTFTGLMPGVDVTVTSASDTPVTLTVVRDDKAVTDVASKLVADLADVFSYINRNAAVTTSTSSGTSKATGGLFTGDSGVRDIKQSLMTAATSPVDGRSPSEIGIVITKDGTVEFDAEKFAAALAADPAKTQATLQTIAGRVEAAGKTASDKYDGTITQRIKGQESEVRSLTTQIEDWDRRLASRQATLQSVWSNLEVKLGQLQSQQEWLTSQIDSLNFSSGSKK
ncbi:flagellar filament capping protein FliD [Arthrobacter gengyunqii]|uniref:Flagellar hook-associated protein 2 n=1 Tax=Arthrobacter gengyunqii TaxID=2886940 RepID=A0A9X1S827_9MICC|nr:flagellar filament capping protein FliD [Arthrobacter gengyunqii]MCC3270942.1 flagellar filament capping protein FliD [Arthrobacter gengyunqii]UOY96566.1 flagellar filament capping protein FliD [Arthrobacter gengyunqii]